MTIDIKDIFKKKNEEESIDFDNIYKNIISQRKIGLVIFIVSFLTIFFPIIIKNKSEPIFKGEFQILIKDPISSQNASTSFSDTVSLPGIRALGQADNLPTLITFLKSETILSKLAEKYGYTSEEFSSLIEIEMGGLNNKADGILNVFLYIDDLSKGEKILPELSQIFINASSKYKQEKLSSGLNFINKEKPNFEKKLDLLQQKIGNYEQKYSIVRDKNDRVINIITKDNFRIDRIKNLEKDRFLSNQQKIGEFNKRALEIENEFKDPQLILKKLNKIESEIKSYTTDIKRFRTLSETYRLEIAQNTIPWRIISQPFMNQSPIKIEYLNIFTLSFLGSSFLTLSILFIYISNKNQFRDEEDIKNNINLKCLGSLPKFKKNQFSEIKNINDLETSLEEKKSKLLTLQKSIEDYCIAIKNLSEKKNFKSFFLASPISHEIKAYVNIISSKILSNTNERVVLVETNFLSPILEKFFNLNSPVGLMDYLADEKIKTSEIINKSNINNYLDVISAGKDLGKNNMILGSPRMKELIENLKNNYQYIIINGPSIKNSPQSAINGSLSDLTTLLISTKSIKKSDLFESVELLIKAGSNIDSFLIIN